MKSLTTLFTLLISACALHAAAARKPNFVFIYTDDQRYDAMGVVQREQGEHARFPWFKTPAMDRLAAEGMRFRNAFVTLSLCSPSRAVFLTSRYNHFNGVSDNHSPFPEDSVTHATLLKSAGYTTAYIGKWHMGDQSGKRPTFDYSASFVGQGSYFDCPIEVNGVKTPSTGFVDDVTTDYAIEFMKQHRDQPFDLVLGFKACHVPLTPPDRAKTRFEGEKARPVPNLGVPAIYRSMNALAQPAKNAQPKAPQAGTPEERLLNQFRLISTADDNLGRVLQALDELGLTDDTVVIFTSDNGYYNGEHGLGDKRTCYEESLRIPMLVRYPRLIAKGTTSDAMVLNLDLAPTLLDLAGVAVPKTMQGASWKPLLAGQPAPGWRQSFFAEYFEEAGYHQIPTTVAVRTTNAKLIKYPGHDEWTELFDLAQDPYETKNLVQDPMSKDLLEKMKAEFDRAAKAVDFRIPDYADKRGTPDFDKKRS